MRQERMKMWMFWRSKQNTIQYTQLLRIRQQLYNYIKQFHFAFYSIRCLCYSLHASLHRILNPVYAANTKRPRRVRVCLCEWVSSMIFKYCFFSIPFSSKYYIVFLHRLIYVARFNSNTHSNDKGKERERENRDVNNNITKTTTHKHTLACVWIYKI